jgi:hypothetical protein
LFPVFVTEYSRPEPIEEAVFEKPYVKNKRAWVGADNFPQEYSKSLSSFSRREFPAFKTREDALAWLAKD